MTLSPMTRWGLLLLATCAALGAIRGIAFWCGPLVGSLVDSAIATALAVFIVNRWVRD